MAVTKTHPIKSTLKAAIDYMDENNSIQLFEDRKIRTAWDEEILLLSRSVMVRLIVLMALT